VGDKKDTLPGTTYHRALLELLEETILVIDATGKILFVSESVESYLQTSPNYLISKSIFSLLHEISQEKAKQVLDDIAATPGGTTHQYLRLKLANSSTLDIHVTARNCIDNPQIGGIVCSVYPIDDSLEHFRNLFYSLPIAAAHSVDNEILDVNPAYEKLFGYSRSEVIGTNPLNLIVNDKTESEAAGVDFYSEGAGHYEIAVRHKSGEVVYCRMYSQRREQRGMRRTATFIDITEEIEQRRLTSALIDSVRALTTSLDLNEVLDRILENVGRVVAHDHARIVLIKDKKPGVVRAVRRMENTSETTITQSVLKAIETADTVFEDDVQGDGFIRSRIVIPIKLDDVVIGALEVGSMENGFFTLEHADILAVFSQHAAIALNNARLYKVVNEAATELTLRNTELNAFSRSVAHDLKAPLQVVVGFANMLRTEFMDEMSKEVLEHVSTIESYANKMNVMVEAMLKLVTVRDAQELVKQVNIRKCIDEAVQRFPESIEARNAEIIIQKDMPRPVGYAPWLVDVFANLFENALKYKAVEQEDPPRIEITAETTKSGMVRFTIKDNGPGIPPDYLHRIFEEGTRADPDAAEGMGLGLSIVRRIINRLDGEVGVESPPGEGAAFWFTLPAAE